MDGDASFLTHEFQLSPDDAGASQMVRYHRKKAMSHAITQTPRPPSQALAAAEFTGIAQQLQYAAGALDASVVPMADRATRGIVQHHECVDDALTVAVTRGSAIIKSLRARHSVIDKALDDAVDAVDVNAKQLSA